MSASSTIFFTILAFIYTIIIFILFTTKKKVNKLENRIFKKLLILSILSMISELSIIFTKDIATVGVIVQKVYLVFIVLWLSRFMDYTFIITMFDKSKTEKENIEKYKFSYYIFLIINLFYSFAIMLSPIEFVNEAGAKYTTGLSVNLVFIVTGIYMTIMFILLITHFKKITKKGYLPIIVLLSLLIGTAIIQNINPQILLTNAVFGLIICIMYNTIENPDLIMLNEYVKNKELVETSAEEKTNVLFKVSQEVRTPIRKINLLGNSILSSNKVDEMHENARDIVNISGNISSIINNVLDITDLDKRNVKIVDTTYNIYNLFSQIVYFGKEKTEKVEFKYSINNVIPKELHGDSTRLKQIICSILYNAFKNTEKGYVDLDISNIIKYDICRLIITISDTGKGMSLETINNIMEDTSEINEKEIEKLNELDINLKLVKKLVDIQGGSMMISSDEKGTVFTVVLDQSFDDKNNFDYIDKASKSISNKQRVLIVDDDYTELSYLSKEFKRNSFDVVTTMYGKDCVDRIANNEVFDYIIIDDEMENYNAVYTISELKKICDVSKLKVIVLLGKDKESIKEHYLEDYPFKDYLLKSNYKSEIERIISNK